MRAKQRDFNGAEAAYRRALELYEGLEENAAGSHSWIVYLFETHTKLGGLIRQKDERLGEAEDHYRRALQQVERLVEKNRKFVNRYRRGRALVNLGGFLRMHGTKEEALSKLDEARALLEGLLEEVPNDARTLGELATAHRRLALLHGDSGRDDQMVESFQSAAAIREQLVAARPKDRRRRSAWIDALENVGVATWRLRRFDAAAEYYGRAADVARETAGLDPKRPTWHKRAHEMSVAAAKACAYQSSFDEAVGWFERAVDHPSDASAHREAGTTAAKLAVHVGSSHESYVGLVKASATSLRVAVDRGVDKETLQGDKAVKSLREEPALDWLFPAENESP